MPFDIATETPAIRVHVLAEALRGKMPAGFRWEFQYIWGVKRCGSSGCALGLASLLWPDKAELLRHGTIQWRAKFFGLSYEDAYRIFFNGDGFYRSGNPRPQTVAKALEAAAAKAHAST